MTHILTTSAARLKRFGWPGLAVLVLGLAVGCAPKAYLEAFRGPFTAHVLPVGPPTWTYTVRTSGMSGIVSVEVVSPADLTDCQVNTDPMDLKFSQKKTDHGLKIVLNATELQKLTFSVTSSKHKKGLVYLKVTDSAGNSQMVGPLAGPV